jgi:GLPGLI family protein
MKKSISLVVMLFTLLMAKAQNVNNGFFLSGSVVYEEYVKLDIQMEGMDEQMAARIPKERKSEKILHFTEEELLFENHQKDNPDEDMQIEEGGMTIRMYEPDNKTYVDLRNKKLIKQQEFMSRVFLIESDLGQDKWKMTGNQLTILDYACQEAITEVDGSEVHAWFTPQIAVAAGPGRYCSLPGLVLAVEMNGGDQKLKAVSIDLKAVDKNLLKKPVKGKKVTQEEFEAIVEEKMKEMGVEEGESGGSGHAVVIRIQQ